MVLNIARFLPRASKRQRRGQVDCPEVTSGDYGPVGFSFFFSDWSLKGFAYYKKNRFALLKINVRLSPAPLFIIHNFI
jgi:hypothetical protein